MLQVSGFFVRSEHRTSAPLHPRTRIRGCIPLASHTLPSLFDSTVASNEIANITLLHHALPVLLYSIALPILLYSIALPCRSTPSPYPTAVHVNSELMSAQTIPLEMH